MELIDNIKKDFAGLIQKYNLSILSPFPHTVKLEGSNCIIEIQRESGIEVYVTFIDKKTDKEYAFMNLLFFRNLQEDKRIASTGLFDYYVKAIELYFSDILIGDFSWAAEYDEFMKRYSRN